MLFDIIFGFKIKLVLLFSYINLYFFVNLIYFSFKFVFNYQWSLFYILVFSVILDIYDGLIDFINDIYFLVVGEDFYKMFVYLLR